MTKTSPQLVKQIATIAAICGGVGFFSFLLLEHARYYVLAERHALPLMTFGLLLPLSVLGPVAAVIGALVAVLRKSGRSVFSTFMAGTGILMALLTLGGFVTQIATYGPSPPSIWCASRLSAIAAVMIDKSQTKGRVPLDNWCDSLVEYGLDGSFLRCPRGDNGPSSYALNENLAGAGDVESDMVVAFEAEPGWNQIGGRQDVKLDNHLPREGANVMFGDGRVRWVRPEDVNDLNWGD